MQNLDSRAQEIGALEAQLERAAQAGRDAEVMALLNRILQLDPRRAPALAAVAQRAFRAGDMQTARTAFQRLLEVRTDDPQEWINLALTCRSLDDEPGEQDALRRALSLDPSNLLGLILRADLLERQGKTHEAAAAHRAVATVAPPMERLHPDLKPAVERAFAFGSKYNSEFADFLEQYMSEQFRTHAGENLKRFRDSVDIMLGRKKRYDSQSMTYHFPNLAPIEFFERADFPWLDPIEAATDAIRDEFLQVLDTEEGFTPYISYPDDVPHNQFAELNNSPRWSAFHLYKGGKRLEENAARCPVTVKLLEGVPAPDQPGRTPAAMFSLLKPKNDHSGAHGRNQCATGHPPPADRSRRLQLPRGERYARVGSGEGLGVRRHDRARSAQRQRQAARGPDIRHLAPASDAAGTGNDYLPVRRHERVHRRDGRLRRPVSGKANAKKNGEPCGSPLSGKNLRIRTSR